MARHAYALWLKVAGICGFLTPIFAFALIFSAIASYSEFSWMNNALSDLGIVSGVASVLFNSGLIIGGALCIVFAIGLFVFLRERTVGKLAAFVFVLASLSLLLIGIFPENVPPTHYIVSVMFFTLLPISLLISVATFGLMHRPRMAVFTLMVAVTAATPWVLYFTVNYAPNVAVPEVISTFAGSMWAMVVSGKMLRQAAHSKISECNNSDS